MKNEPGFTGADLDRADNLRQDAEKIAALAAQPDARLLNLAGLDPVLDDNGAMTWSPLPPGETDLIFLGLRGGIPHFAPLVSAPPGQRAWFVFGILNRMAPADAAIWGAARSLLEWHGRHRFCANCGARSEVFRAGWGRRCAACAAEHFPRVDPVVIMLAE
ncbi:MAG TPA: NADH pyrophosphatase zinc ribbon domain-containing protein, partial [Allosphingosinicella sp.]